MKNYIIGRQPILGRDLKIYAYELLYRSAPISSLDGSAATQQLITDLLLEQGLIETVGKHKAFINLTRENLLDPAIEALPKEKVVLEILEDVVIDEQLIEAVKSLSSQGYLIALDDFVFSPEWEPLIEIANIIKLDLRVQTREENSRLIKQLKSRNVALLAEKVESYEEYEYFLNLGCDYFQGFFFCEPALVKGTRLNSNQSTTLRLLSEINNPNVQPGDIATVIQQDVGLSHKLIKYINSAFFALPQEIESIKHATVLLGISEIKRWATLIAISDISDKPSQLLHIALQRAKMSELLAAQNSQADTSSYFLIGLFSTLDALLDMPMNQILGQLNLSKQATAALTSREGTAGTYLENIIHYQKWELDKVDMDLDEMSAIFRESLSWEKELLSSL